MSNFTRPVASSIGGVDFGFLSEEHIKAISVKQIYATPTFDSLNQPIPGGLYDPALGAWGDYNCTTCRQSLWSCTGHSGHIEMPIHVYNVTFFDQLLRLLKAQCVYCFRLRMSRVQVNEYVCKLKLLQHGLIEDMATLEKMEIRKGTFNPNEEGSDSGEGEDQEDFMKRRHTFVRRCIRRAVSQQKSQGTTGLKDPLAAEQRRTIVREFLKDISVVNKCSSCSGISPKFRRDKYSKIFRKPLPLKQKAAMSQASFQAPNPVILIQQSNPTKPKEALSEEFEGDDGSSVSSESHGAEEQVARDNATITDIEAKGKGKNAQSSAEQQQFVLSSEVHAYLTLLFEKEQEIFDLVYSSRPLSPGDPHVKADIFFTKYLLVPPNRYRPAVAQGSSEIVEAQQNSSFTKILKICDYIHTIQKEKLGDNAEPAVRAQAHREFLQATVQLQDAVNSLIDRDRNPVQGAAAKQNEDGIKQRLEKKDGLFRKNMMGKRVNFAARSVISPDPNIETNEIGVPLVFAKKLTYPEPVTNHNFWELKQAVINGPDVYPGAAAIENEVGQVVSLKMKDLEERTALAHSLLAPSSWRMKRSRNKKVYRHLTTGDVVLMNRQPTLHKPSIMGHRARVLPGERTIRMHYANCNTYNADFDGDEMNLHFPQNEIARAEAMQLADTDHQYLVATSGKPLRGLIQDHISMGTWFTSRDTFFDEDDYHQLLYSCLRPESSHTTTDRIRLVDPAIIRPEPRWTGKQIITTVLKNITPHNRVGLNLTGNRSSSAEHWDDETESRAIFQDGELLCGILDKAQLGPTAGGLIHSIHEVYGHVVAGKLIGILGRLLTKFLHMRAFTCGMDDLRLTKAGELERQKKLEKAKTVGHEVAMKYVTLDNSSEVNQDAELRRRLEDVLRDDEKQAGLDGVSNSRTVSLSSEITAACLPRGLVKQFPRNQMQAMTVSGAKGSIVNANLISCNLGQQVLEGRRVPVMISGKTLPSFQPFETNVMAGGYVSGRFLTGIKPQEYYFHAMAGREGLIDTAVKTSRSGYLQRCLIKGMEGLKAEYDTSVRESSDGSMIQFLYGEDGLDITKQKHLQEFSFLATNYLSIVSQLNARNFNDRSDQEAATWNKTAMRKVRKTGAVDAMDPAISKFHPGGYLGSTSELFTTALKKYESENPDKILKDKKNKTTGQVSKKSFVTLMNMKYMRSVVDPGEAVGIVAGQSIGEPSTQMTLNTFHLAGHSTKNVTLGIPRLREIVMTASDNILTPTMTALLNPEISDEHAEKFAKAISKLTLAEIVDRLRVQERISSGEAYETAKVYDIRLDFFPPDEYMEEYKIGPSDILKALQDKFVSRLVKLTRAELKKRTEEQSLSANSAAQPDIGASSGTVEEASREADRDGEEDDMDENEDDDDDADGKNAAKNRSNPISYDAPDEGEATFPRQRTPEFDFGDESDGANDGDEDMQDADDPEAEATKNPRAGEETVKNKYPEVTRFRFNPRKGNSCNIQLQYDISTPKLLLLPLVEKAVHDALLQSIDGLGDSSFVPEENGKPRHIDTEGVNLLAMRDYQDVIVPHSIYTNSIADMLSSYGVEAARATIVKEMSAVFGGHGIAVDNRHLNLIGDVMTQAGGFKAFNRMGVVRSSTSPFMKMSFETTVGFLKDAVLERDYDTLTGPSGRIVSGQVGKIGTGGFDVLAPVG